MKKIHAAMMNSLLRPLALSGAAAMACCGCLGGNKPGPDAARAAANAPEPPRFDRRLATPEHCSWALNHQCDRVRQDRPYAEQCLKPSDYRVDRVLGVRRLSADRAEVHASATAVVPPREGAAAALGGENKGGVPARWSGVLAFDYEWVEFHQGGGVPGCWFLREVWETAWKAASPEDAASKK